MRVGIIGLSHESNTFIQSPTTFEEFRRNLLLVGEEVRQEYGDAHHEVGGFLQGLSEANFEAVPILLAGAMPSGRVTEDALTKIMEIMHRGLDEAGELDGLLLAPHGAAVSVPHPDMDGYWLEEVRNRVGGGLPIVCTIDPHANLTQRMIDACNATVAYRSNPHLDQRDRGREAANLMAQTLRGEIHPVQSASFPNVAMNIERQLTSQPPCLPMYDIADSMLTRDGVLSNSIVLGFPYADVYEMGSSFVVVTDNQPKLAQELADELAAYIVEHRAGFQADLTDVEKAIDLAGKTNGPVCLLDMGDNVGGGSSADGTFIASAIHRRGGPKTLVCINDPESVAQAVNAGAGNRVTLAIGGKVDDMHGAPLTTEVAVSGIYDGHFTEPEARHGGKTSYDMGPTAVVESETSLTFLLTSHRTPPFSLGQITSCGLDPADFQILVAKGVHAPTAAYGPVSKRMLRVNTPGSTSADMAHFKFEHRRAPLYPFEEI